MGLILSKHCKPPCVVLCDLFACTDAQQLILAGTYPVKCHLLLQQLHMAETFQGTIWADLRLKASEALRDSLSCKHATISNHLLIPCTAQTCQVCHSTTRERNTLPLNIKHNDEVLSNGLCRDISQSSVINVAPGTFQGLDSLLYM
jgi:hypothetical protein